MTNCNLVEVTANLAEILPQNAAAGTYLSQAFTMSNFRHVVAQLCVGTPSAGGIVNSQLMWSATSGGTYAAVTGGQMAQMSAAGIQQIEMRADRVNALGQGPYFKLQVVVTVASVPFSATITGVDCRFEPANQFNDTTVVSPDIII